MYDEYIFKVKGSTEEPYEVSFLRRSKTNLSAYCSCPAGKKGMHCKHRLKILLGDSEGVVSNNIEHVKQVSSWLPGSDVEAILQKVKNLEAESEKIKKEISIAKKALAKALHD